MPTLKRGIAAIAILLGLVFVVAVAAIFYQRHASVVVSFTSTDLPFSIATPHPDPPATPHRCAEAIRDPTEVALLPNMDPSFGRFFVPPPPKRRQGPCQASFYWVERSKEAKMKRFPTVTHQYAVCWMGGHLLDSKDPSIFQHSIGFWYPCWSWFQLNPNATPVVCDSYVRYGSKAGMTSHNAGNRTQRWTAGMVDLFKRAGVIFLKWPCDLGRCPEIAANSTRAYFPTSWFAQSTLDRRGWFVQPGHATALARYAVMSDQPALIEEDARVGILDRAGRRGIENIGEVLTETRKHWQTATVAYFENTTFIQQVRWFHNHDMVVSPHGAQCSSIPFMPPCGAFLEIHFKYSTGHPKVFGGLAADSGLISGYLYLSSNSPEADLAHAAVHNVEKEYKVIKQSRSCVPPKAVVDGLKQLEQRRKSCVAKNNGQISDAAR